MGDREAVVSEPSALMDYTSTGYSDASSNVVPSTGASPSEATGVFSAPADINSRVHGDSDLGDGNAHATDLDPNNIQEAHVITTSEANLVAEVANTIEKVTDLENASTEFSKVHGNISSLNGSDGVGVENGHVPDHVGRSADEQQFDGFGMFSHLHFLYLCVMMWFYYLVSFRIYIIRHGKAVSSIS